MRWIVMIGLGLFGACATLPRETVDLYDAAKPDGWMQIEAERNGKVIAMEADIPIADLPASIQEAGRRQLPQGRITGGEKEYQGGKLRWEVKMNHQGRDYEFVFTPEGELVMSEKELMRNEAPAGVVEAALQSLPGSTFKSIELITEGGKEFYHVKVIQQGASCKVIVGTDGAILRKVREHKTELEIPLE